VQIGILGTGQLAAALGTAWARAGHNLVIAGRSHDNAETLARKLGPSARASAPRAVVIDSAAVLLAVAWAGVPGILRDSAVGEGTMNGIPLIDPTNPVEHGLGVVLTPPGTSAAQQIATSVPGAHVVKAFHLFPAAQWLAPQTATNTSRPTVPLCGDDPAALEVVAGLVRDVGATPAVLGPLHRARQLEEVAGFIIGLAFTGHDPSSTVPRVHNNATA